MFIQCVRERKSQLRPKFRGSIPRTKISTKGGTVDNVTIIRIVAGFIFLVVLLPVAIIPYWVIFKKAGFSPFLSFLMVIPFVGLVVLYVIAFSQWSTTQISEQPRPPLLPSA
jgi:hypothetical protein